MSSTKKVVSTILLLTNIAIVTLIWALFKLSFQTYIFLVVIFYIPISTIITTICIILQLSNIKVGKLAKYSIVMVTIAIITQVIFYMMANHILSLMAMF